MRTARILALLGALIASPTAARAQGSAAHGGDVLKDQENPWFLGDEPVEYCIDRAADYALSEETLATEVSEALAQWKDFFARHGLDRARFTGLAGEATVKGLSLAFVRVPACDEPSRQLAFLFGKTNALVDQHQAALHNALGAAVRDTYNHLTHRTGGVLWLAAWPYDRVSFRHLLLHELGHVFGMPHDSVFVMDALVSERIVRKLHDPADGMIESPSWPYRPQVGATLDLTYNDVCTDAGAPRTGYQAASLLPRQIAALLDERFGACVKIVLTRRPDRGDPGPLPQGEWTATFELAIEGERGDRVALEGRFHAGNDATRAPRGIALFTQWRDVPVAIQPIIVDQRYFGRRELEPEAGRAALPAHGVLARGRTRLAAAIDVRRGAVLMVALPGTAEWWIKGDRWASPRRIASDLE